MKDMLPPFEFCDDADCMAQSCRPIQSVIQGARPVAANYMYIITTVAF